MSDDFNPNSHDAMFSRILQRMDQQDEKASATKDEYMKIFVEIRDQVKLTNGRVTKLEQWKAFMKGKNVAISAGVSAAVGFVGWAISMLWK